MSSVDHILNSVAQLATVACYPDCPHFTHVGYVVPMTHHGGLVSCDECSEHKPSDAIHVFQSDLAPFSQHCHLCGQVLAHGEFSEDRWDNPMAEEDQPTLPHIPIFFQP